MTRPEWMPESIPDHLAEVMASQVVLYDATSLTPPEDLAEFTPPSNFDGSEMDWRMAIQGVWPYYNNWRKQTGELPELPEPDEDLPEVVLPKTVDGDPRLTIVLTAMTLGYTSDEIKRILDAYRGEGLSIRKAP